MAALATVVALIVLAAFLIRSGGKSAPPPLPLPGVGQPAKPGDPLAYVPAREPDFAARATAGSDHVLFVKSPGGALTTAARVAAFRPLIDSAVAGTGIDPSLLEALVFVESAGRPTVIAGGDPASASGLTQILAQTGQSLLGMHIDLARSRRLTAQIDEAAARGQNGRVARLVRARAKVDDRFEAGKALAATVRYLQISERRFGRWDLAFESYHMGIGNLQSVLNEYDSGRPAAYVQLYFDTAPDHHPAAYHLLASFGDDSSLYYWRLLGAQRIMRLYRSDRAALGRLAGLQTAAGSNAQVLHPPDLDRPFGDPDALDRAYAAHAILPLPSNATRLGLRYDPGLGALASRLGFTPALSRGLRPPALDLLIALAGRVRSLSGSPGSTLTVTSAVSDLRYQQLLGVSDPPAACGWSFTIARHYAGRAQAAALQAMLDRLQALDLIAWERFPSEIEITVASDASQALVHGP
ncbi:MAG: transglycosylase SLT domain-containing protein [Solirubrobacterales bacterium]|nr:transglycosylase SLT domain-containing protein [Solirubrobacterales bacterium]